jgi:hypothetical protein
MDICYPQRVSPCFSRYHEIFCARPLLGLQQCYRELPWARSKIPCCQKQQRKEFLTGEVYDTGSISTAKSNMRNRQALCMPQRQSSLSSPKVGCQHNIASGLLNISRFSITITIPEHLNPHYYMYQQRSTTVAVLDDKQDMGSIVLPNSLLTTFAGIVPGGGSSKTEEQSGY